MPKCPDNPAYHLERIMSAFAITGRAGAEEKPAVDNAESLSGDTADAGEADNRQAGGADDARMEAAFGQLEGEMDSVDENDPRAMGRMIRRMSELTGETLDEQMEEVVRKLEEGADPDKLEEAMGDALPDGGEEGAGGPGRGRGAPTRDPHLYDY